MLYRAILNGAERWKTKMGSKYMAHFAEYPYKGYWEFDVQGKHLIPFLFKVFKLSKKYQIIDISYRNT